MIFALTVMVCFNLIISSCNKKEPVVEFTHATMRPWFDTYCKSCHSPGNSNAGKWNYNSADFNNTVKKYISDIKQTVVDKKSMPQGTTLSGTELQKFVDWYNAGFPLN